MLRLTLRSRDDGRFLARVIDRDGFVFVLDYGDPAMVADATDRVTRGFSMWRAGKLETVAPASPELLGLLGEFYVAEGLDVSVEDDQGSRSLPPPDGPTPLDAGIVPPAGPPDELAAEETELVGLAEEETELVSLSDVPDLGDDLETWVGPRRTNPGALQKRKLWRPPGTPTPKPVLPRKRKPRPPPEASAAPPPQPAQAPELAPEQLAVEPPPPGRVDEEETELVPHEMRQAALNDEDLTELHGGSDEPALAQEDP